MECLGLHNKPKAEVHLGHKLTGPKEVVVVVVVRQDASRHFRSKKREYLKAQIDEFQTNSTNMSITMQTCDFKKGYQPKTNTV
jgi:hypothetical protein